MVIHDLDVGGIACLPSEADTPAVVNADTELSFTVPSERFEPVVGRSPEIVQPSCTVQIKQLPSRHTLEAPKTQHVDIRKQSFGVTVAETLYHSVKSILFSGIIQTE
jgi:hypothetical protein